VGDTRGDFVEEGLLGFAQGGFGKKFEMLLLKSLSNILRIAHAVLSTYSCALQDFAESGKVVNTGVQCIDGGIEKLERRLKGGNGRGERCRSSHDDNSRGYSQY